jgi:septum formation protein
MIGAATNPPALVLASTSVYRRELLKRLQLAFEVAPPLVDESAIASETPPERAQRLSLAKAEAVSLRFPQATVIGSDQVAVSKGEVLEKPGNAARCREQLAWLSGAAAVFYTAVAVIPGAGARAALFVDTTTVYFRTLTESEIERYIAADKPFDCAGGIRSESLGISLFTRIVSEDSTALIGLPLISLARSLRQLGYAVP